MCSRCVYLCPVSRPVKRCKGILTRRYQRGVSERSQHNWLLYLSSRPRYLSIGGAQTRFRVHQHPVNSLSRQSTMAFLLLSSFFHSDLPKQSPRAVTVSHPLPPRQHSSHHLFHPLFLLSRCDTSSRTNLFVCRLWSKSSHSATSR